MLDYLVTNIYATSPAHIVELSNIVNKLLLLNCAQTCPSVEVKMGNFSDFNPMRCMLHRIFTYIYHQNQRFMWVNIPYMDPMGIWEQISCHVGVHLFPLDPLMKKTNLRTFNSSKLKDIQLHQKSMFYLQGGPPTSYNWVYNSYN